MLQKRRKRFHRPERSWPPFFGTRKASSSPTIWRMEGRTGHYYADLLGRFEAELMKKFPIWRKKCSFTMTKHQLTHSQLPQQNWSNYDGPDLAPCDFFMFPNMKKWLSGKRFTSNEQVIAATEAYFAEFDKPYFLDGFKKLEYRWTKWFFVHIAANINISRKRKFFLDHFEKLVFCP